MQLYSRFYQALDGFWYLAVKENTDDEQAQACDIWVWEKLIRYQIKHLAKEMNIQGDDIAALLKIFQVDPFFWHFGYEIELIDRNRGLLTVNQCPTLEALEKEGGDRIKTICWGVEPIIFRQYAKSINPNMQVKVLKLPPRQNHKEICCQWEFILE